MKYLSVQQYSLAREMNGLPTISTNMADEQKLHAMIISSLKVILRDEYFCWTCAHKSTLQLCSRCKKVRYCSSACQRQDWPEHKKICN